MSSRSTPTTTAARRRVLPPLGRAHDRDRHVRVREDRLAHRPEHQRPDAAAAARPDHEHAGVLDPEKRRAGVLEHGAHADVQVGPGRWCAPGQRMGGDPVRLPGEHLTGVDAVRDQAVAEITDAVKQHQRCVVGGGVGGRPGDGRVAERRAVHPHDDGAGRDRGAHSRPARCSTVASGPGSTPRSGPCRSTPRRTAASPQARGPRRSSPRAPGRRRARCAPPADPLPVRTCPLLPVRHGVPCQRTTPVHRLSRGRGPSALTGPDRGPRS